jgi:hypothetical protein
MEEVMLQFTRQVHRATRGVAGAFAAVGSLVLGACASDQTTAGPRLPEQPPAAQFRPVAFIADINTRTGEIRITDPASGTTNRPTLSLEGGSGPSLSLLGADAVRLVPSNYTASAVGAFQPNKVRVSFDVAIENKLPGIRFITPTWPTPPAGAGVVLFPLDYTVTTTPGGVTGGDGNVIIVEQPNRGNVEPSIDWNGLGTAGSGAPFSFFNDTDCSAAASNDCFRWESYENEILPLSGSAAKRIGFDIDASVGQFRVRMIVAADLAPAGTVAPGTIAGDVTSPTRGPLSGVTVNVSSGQTGTTSATGAYSIASVNPGSRTVTLANLPAGCTAPAAQTVTVATGATVTANFSVTCSGVAGTITGRVISDEGNAPLNNVTLTASTGGTGTTNATGDYTISGVGAGAGTITFSGLPAGCVAPATSYTMPSGGSLTVNVTVDCPTAPAPGYQYNTTWTALPSGQIQLDLRIDMRTFNDPTITDVTTAGVTGDPLTGAQLSFTYDATKLSFVEGVGTGAPQISGAPTVNGATPGQVNVLNGTTTLLTGNVGIVRVIFDRVAGATGQVSTTTTLIAVSSRTGGVTRNILANVRNTETPFTLP